MLVGGNPPPPHPKGEQTHACENLTSRHPNNLNQPTHGYATTELVLTLTLNTTSYRNLQQRVHCKRQRLVIKTDQPKIWINLQLWTLVSAAHTIHLILNYQLIFLVEFIHKPVGLQSILVEFLTSIKSDS